MKPDKFIIEVPSSESNAVQTPVTKKTLSGDEESVRILVLSGAGCVALIMVLVICGVSFGYINTVLKPTEITWFVGLGTGAENSQLAAERAVVSDFNTSQSHIHLNLEIIPYASSVGTLGARIAAGNGPDIVGPVGFLQLNHFKGQWLDLTPYIRPVDTQPYQEGLVKMFHTADGQLALPFAIYPSALYYNQQLFDRAGLKYPPARYGDAYQMPDGSQLAWSWDTLAQVSRLLTLDRNGNNATQAGFDPKNIVQYGYSWTFETHPSYVGSYWGGGSMIANDGHAQLPPAWRAAWEWTYDGVWGHQPFITSQQVENAAAYKSNAFDSGTVAMTVQPAWYPCCISDVKTWDLAVMPSYQGKVSGRIDVDSFYIWKKTAHPKEAYQVLLYLLNQGTRTLLYSSGNDAPPYGGMSARADQQQAWVAVKKRDFPWVKNWNAILDGINYPDLPSSESTAANGSPEWMRGYDFQDRMFGTPSLSMTAEEQSYLDDLNKILEAKP